MRITIIPLLLAVLLSCSEKPKTQKDTVIQMSNNLLSSFIDNNLEKIYGCRSDEFKNKVSYDVYAKSVNDTKSVVELESFKILSINFRDGIYFSEFEYFFNVDGVRSSKRDILVLRPDDDDYVCLDLGFRFFFELNSPLIKKNL